MPLELTEREIALARGEDPNKIEEPAPSGDDKEVEGVKDDAAEKEAEEKAEEQAEEEAKEEKAEKPAKKESKKKDSEEETKEEAKSEEEDFDLDPKKYEEEGYDEETVKLVKYTKKLKDDLKQFQESVKQLQEVEATREHQRRLDEFHEICDSFEDDLFGRSLDKDGNVAELSKEADENRRKVYEEWAKLHNDAVKKALAKAEKSGEQPEIPTAKALIKTAREKALAKELLALDRKKVQRQIEEQSKKRRPVSGSIARREFAPTGEGKKDIDPIKAIANDPRIVKFWNETQDENGKS